MKDAITNDRIEVLSEGTGGPYIMVALSQLGRIAEMLKTKGVPHWVDEDAISIDGEPEVAVINLGRNANVRQVQNLLDEM